MKQRCPNCDHPDCTGTCAAIPPTCTSCDGVDTEQTVAGLWCFDCGDYTS